MRNFLDWFFAEEPDWFMGIFFLSAILLFLNLIGTYIFYAVTTGYWYLFLLPVFAVVVYSWYRVIKDYLNHNVIE